MSIKMSIKDRNGRDLIEAEDIKKRWQEYTDCTKKSFMIQIIIIKFFYLTISPSPVLLSLW